MLLQPIVSISLQCLSFNGQSKKKTGSLERENINLTSFILLSSIDCLLFSFVRSQNMIVTIQKSQNTNAFRESTKTLNKSGAPMGSYVKWYSFFFIIHWSISHQDTAVGHRRVIVLKVHHKEAAFGLRVCAPSVCVFLFFFFFSRNIWFFSNISGSHALFTRPTILIF